MIVPTIHAEMEGLALIRLMTFSVYVSLRLMVKSVKERWIHVPPTLVKTEQHAHPMVTIRNIHALVFSDIKGQDVRLILMNVQQLCPAEMELLASILMEVTYARVSEALKVVTV